MATKKISELNALTTPDNNDLLAIVDTSATETKKITYGNISKHIINVGTEVEEDSRINFIKSKNLFDKNNVNKLVAYFNESTPTITSSEFNRTLYLPCNENTTYTITIPNGTGAYAIGYTTTIPTIGSSVSGVSNTSKTITTGANAKYLVMRYFQTNNATITEQQAFDGIQIEYGDTATSYKEFIPNQIVVDNETFTDTLKVGTNVDGKSKVNVIHSRNLFDKNNVNTLNAYFVDGTNNITADTSGNNKTIYIPCKPNTTYTIQKTASPSNRAIGYTTTTPAVGVAVQGAINISANTTTGSITTGNNAQYLVIRVWSSSQDTITYDQMIASVQIEEGSTATSYEPMQPNQIVVDNEKYSDTINVGSVVDSRSRVNVLKSNNLWKQLPNTQTLNGITLTNNGNGTFNLSGTATANTSFYTELDLGSANLKNVTYTLSKKSVGYNIQLDFYNGTTYVSTPIYCYGSTLENSATLSIGSNVNKVRYIIYVANGSSVSLTNEQVMFNEGSSALPFEPYVTPSINVDGEEIYSKGVTLYNGGTTGSDLSSPISFNDSLANYERIEIYYGTSRPYYITTFYSNYGQHQYFEPSLQFYYLNNADSSFYIYITLLTISQSAMELHSSRGSRTVTISSNGTITNTKSTTSSTIKIYKVIGYK